MADTRPTTLGRTANAKRLAAAGATHQSCFRIPVDFGRTTSKTLEYAPRVAPWSPIYAPRVAADWYR